MNLLRASPSNTHRDNLFEYSLREKCNCLVDTTAQFTMRLTVELINRALSYNNPTNERELNLRGHKIPNIENLGAARDPECIDFTDNDLLQLDNFPLSARLRTLLCAHNRITSISAGTSKSTPNLQTLVLSHNNIAELSALDALQGLPKLQQVTLIGNPVAAKENYRYYILWRQPSIRYLDLQKVKDAERARAVELFGTFEEPTDLAKSVMASGAGATSGLASMTLTNGSGRPTNGAGARAKFTQDQEKRLRVLINKATSLAEVQRLEKALNEGRLPAGLGGDDAMDES